MQKRFKLLKDLPNAKIGSIYRQTGDGEDYINYDLLSKNSWDVAYPPSYIENNPSWFQEVVEDERVEISFIPLVTPGWYQIYTGYYNIPQEKFPAIKNLLERYLNGEMDNPAPSALNDTVVDNAGTQIMAEWHPESIDIWIERPLSGVIKINGETVFRQSEVDAIRKRVWDNARHITYLASDKKNIGLDNYPFTYKELSDYLSSLNLNTNDTVVDGSGTDEYVKGWKDGFNQGVEFMAKPTNDTGKKMRVGEDMICPVTKKHCDDECCTVGSICNVSSNDIKDCKPEQSSPIPTNNVAEEKIRELLRVSNTEDIDVLIDWLRNYFTTELFTKEQMDKAIEDAFNAARERVIFKEPNGMIGYFPSTYVNKFTNIKEYFNHLKQNK